MLLWMTAKSLFVWKKLATSYRLSVLGSGKRRKIESRTNKKKKKKEEEEEERKTGQKSNENGGFF